MPRFGRVDEWMALIKEGAVVPIMAEINIAPFTDVLLVLAIIFTILGSLVAQPGFEWQYPCGGHMQRAKQRALPLDVAVTAAGAISIGGQRTSDRAVYDDLRVAMSSRFTRAIALEADENAPYGAVLRVLDAAKADGDADVILVVH